MCTEYNISFNNIDTKKKKRKKKRKKEKRTERNLQHLKQNILLSTTYILVLFVLVLQCPIMFHGDPRISVINILLTRLIKCVLSNYISGCNACLKFLIFFDTWLETTCVIKPSFVMSYPSSLLNAPMMLQTADDLFLFSHLTKAISCLQRAKETRKYSARPV